MVRLSSLKSDCVMSGYAICVFLRLNWKRPINHRKTGRCGQAGRLIDRVHYIQLDAKRRLDARSVGEEMGWPLAARQEQPSTVGLVANGQASRHFQTQPGPWTSFLMLRVNSVRTDRQIDRQTGKQTPWRVA